MEAILALEDGRVFRGRAFGARGEHVGEVVFNTSMTGYQEILTDPSYRGQIIVMTYPEIGTYGVNTDDSESGHPQVEGMVVRELTATPSNWRATRNLQHYLSEHGVPGITALDTRALTRHIRTGGALRGVLSHIDRDIDSLVKKAQNAPRLEDRDLVGEVTRAVPEVWSVPRDPRWRTTDGATPGAPRMRCVAYDFGVKDNILRLLTEHGFDVTVVPATHSAEDTLRLGPDAVFLSNGPGDPAQPTYAVETVRALLGRVPVFGICLGFQIVALALGARTFKLKFGHRGANHPVRDARTGRVEITSQNHGYAVDTDSLPDDVEVTHINLNDGTCEGFVDPARRLLAVQYHPESSPGPHDSVHLFGAFRNMVAADEVREVSR